MSSRHRYDEYTFKHGCWKLKDKCGSSDSQGCIVTEIQELSIPILSSLFPAKKEACLKSRFKDTQTAKGVSSLKFRNYQYLFCHHRLQLRKKLV